MVDGDEEAKETLLEDRRTFEARPRVQKHALRYIQVLPWALTLFFCCTTAFLALRQNVQLACKNEFSTDFVPAYSKLEVEMIQEKFTNDLRFNATSHTLYNDPLDPQETQYIGLPTPQLDVAWESLLRGQYVAITTDEVEQFPPDHREALDGAHYFELSVFHNLHCLNEIRKGLDRDYYKDEMYMDRVHMDHCIDQIRQALQCHGDLTPVPMLPVAGGIRGSALGNGEMHTCKNFTKIREWVDKREKLMRPLGG